MRVVSSTNISQMLHAIVWSVCSVQYVIQNMDTTMLFDILSTLFQICVVLCGLVFTVGAYRQFGNGLLLLLLVNNYRKRPRQVIHCPLLIFVFNSFTP